MDKGGYRVVKELYGERIEAKIVVTIAYTIDSNQTEPTEQSVSAAQREPRRSMLSPPSSERLGIL